MLQLVQGMYFRDVPLTDTVHRGILYTNLRAFGDREPIDLPFGRLLPSTAMHGVGSMTIEARERLEAETESGSPEVLVATSGEQLIDEIAAVVSFCLNVVCVRDFEMARRLISTSDRPTHQRFGSVSILRQTFDATIVLSDESIADLTQFFESLTGLQRKSYEAAIRAIRQIVDAMLMVDEDATLAYTLMVAAMESLGQATKPKAGSWSDYDQQKRARVDEATKGLSEKRREKIQGAILANEHSALTRRFVAFVLEHVEPSFFRAEAVKALRPITANELPTALQEAYGIRSRNVHTLQNLAPEVWMQSDRADTSHVEDTALLSLEGLARLSRHVVRRFVERAPKGVDKTFNYRSALPGIMRARLAPQLWIHDANFFSSKSAPGFFEGTISYLIEGMSGRSETGLVPMTAVLDKIEKTAPGLAKSEDRLPMAGVMALWNACAPKEHRRKLKLRLKKQFDEDLTAPSMVSFALAMVLGAALPWSLEDYKALAASRREELRRKTHQPLPKRIDAALYILIADQLLAIGDKASAMVALGQAVETVPGLADLIDFEAALERGDDPTLNLRPFILGEETFVTWDKKETPDEVPANAGEATG
ncbi:hypothetical protein [Sphingomonas carotinifaciens]|uniref:Uncharacterized protein n=1 Tax=Sphingomonas carotinifaciens TaxID=1166323 RepID=A0A1G7NGJ3_9SPHN|nr:hypothetical protein [Sphingomonas carotinifaciens]MBB4087086.1 hypothetical protein [Sphingomonas carotinifaciens]MWC43227.1 hypothetical protein [Sphingomonas carotinifaciens]SDF73184.1 hypothetical protein SAMN05216557_105159 [Sphingomonas carotinifaciens]